VILRTNLSTRPFYNENVVTAVLVLLAAIGLGLTAFNVWQIRSLTSERADFVAQRARDERMTQQFLATAAKQTSTIDKANLDSLTNATRDANALIDARTFSWTVLFGLLEKTMPMDVRLVAVSPTIDKGQIKITMIVVAKQDPEIEKFINALYALQGSGTFYDIVPRERMAADETNPASGFRATIEAYYLPQQVGPSTSPAGKKSSLLKRGRP
jgi:hypothetical protein